MESDQVQAYILLGLALTLHVIAVGWAARSSSRIWSDAAAVGVALVLALLWLVPAGMLIAVVVAYVLHRKSEEALRLAAHARWNATHGSDRDG